MSRLVTRSAVHLRADPARVVARPLVPRRDRLVDAAGRPAGLLARLLALPDAAVDTALVDVRARYGDRHRDLDGVLDRHAALVADIAGAGRLPEPRRLLLGALLTNEFAIEGAALFNPAAVPAPDQSGVPSGACRFVLSLRAVGEGHVSCVEFRTGIAGPGTELELDDPGRQVEVGEVTDLDHSAYRTAFGPQVPLGGRVLWPHAGPESQGIEDARFVRYEAPGLAPVFRATYTAYDGHHIEPRVIETADFATFVLSALDGPAARNKGMALFPRPLGGRQLALTRSDGESNGIASSADGIHWDTPVALLGAASTWELVQTGNCGSPIETAAGWLVFTHGVGPMREYAIGALLLDLAEPTRVLGALREPLLRPKPDDRDGYVPSVVYSCGPMSLGDRVLLPYGINDAAVGFAFVDVPLLLERLMADGPPATSANSAA